MITKLKTEITIKDICTGFVYNELEGKGLFGLSGKLTIQPEYQRNYIYADGKRDVSVIDLKTKILDKESALPIIFAPTGYTRMMHYQGEVMVAKVCDENNLIYEKFEENVDLLKQFNNSNIIASSVDARRGDKM